jgi:hypothetical protein
MGTRNRQRRAEKLRRRQRASTPRTDRRFDHPPVRELIYAAIEAVRRSERGLFHELVAVMASSAPTGLVAELDAVAGEVLTVVWSRNWEAAEVGRQAERRLGSDHARRVDTVIRRASAPSKPDDPVAVSGLAVTIEVLAFLLSLPPLPTLGDTRGPVRRETRRGQDPRVLAKVRALLAKAESTTFPEEAEALSAKAQELMARHAIDAAMVGGRSAGGRDPVGGDGPTGVRLPVDDPYAGAKSILLSQVASANRCRAVWSKDLAISTVLGFEADLEFVEILYTSLLVQATSAMVAAGSQVDRYGRSRTRSFRQSFLLAYAYRIGERLQAAEAAARAEATEEYGPALLPVLADRSAAVDAARDAAFPGAVRRSVSVTNAAGWAAGSAAADLASLASRAEVPAGSARAG